MKAPKGRSRPLYVESTQHFLNGGVARPSSPVEGELNNAQRSKDHFASRFSRPIPITQIFMLILAEAVLSACGGGGGGNSTGRFMRTWGVPNEDESLGSRAVIDERENIDSDGGVLQM